MSQIDGKSMLEVLREFTEKAEAANIPYMVTGSFAMAAYDEFRFTRDIDIVIEIGNDQVRQFYELFKDTFYINEDSIKRAIDRQSMFNIIHLENAVKLDCIVRKESEFEKLKFKNRRKASVKDLTFWVINKEDLILSKLNWARDSFSEMQIKDLNNLLSGNCDRDYIIKWVDRLGLQEIWQKVS